MSVQFSRNLMMAKMVSRSLTQRFPEKTNTPGEVVLQVKNLTAKNQPSIRDVSFELRKGEVLGIGGLVGAKRTDIVETLFGIRKRGAGEVLLHGKEVFWWPGRCAGTSRSAGS